MREATDPSSQSPVEDLTDCPVYTPGDRQSQADVGAWLKSKYGVPFPADFFHLWDFCCQRDAANPRGAYAAVVFVVIVVFAHV